MTLTQKLMLQFCDKKTGLKRTPDWRLKADHTKNYKFIVYNSFSIALGILGNFLREINIKKSLIFSGTFETSFDTSPPPKSLSLDCK